MRRIFFLALCAALLILGGCDNKPPQFVGTDITGADYAKDFALTDHTGKPRTMADFRGKAVVIFFGYTQCPDVCPTAMVTLVETLKLLGEDAKKVQVLFITVDPERDTPQLLAQYVPAFNPGFIGLYGDQQATAKTAQSFHVFYQKQPGNSPTSYTVDHSTGSYVFDPQGRLRLYVSHGAKPDQMANDLKQLIAGK